MKNTMIGLPPGFRDLLFDQAKKRRYLEERLARLFEERGYGEIVPSAVEYLELYRRGAQGIEEKTVRFLDREDNLLALRADFTPAIARIVTSRRGGEPLPLRVWYSGSVFRKVDPKLGRSCELVQVGAELIGANSLRCDAEILDLALDALERAGISGALLHLNHAGIFRGIIQELSLDKKVLRRLKAAIDRKDTRDLAGQLETLGVSAHVHDQLASLASCTGGIEVLERAADILTHPLSCSSLEALKDLAGGLEKKWKEGITFDLAEIDEMEYYTGIMFTFYHPRLNVELGRGGRYDGLLASFGQDLPAIGFSFSMDALMELV